MSEATDQTEREKTERLIVALRNYADAAERRIWAEVDRTGVMPACGAEVLAGAVDKREKADALEAILKSEGTPA